MRPLPVLSVPTHADRVAFMHALYAGGLRWCSFDLTFALSELEANRPVYDGCPIVWLEPYGQIMFDGLGATDGLPTTRMNSPHQFVSYARALMPELEAAANIEMGDPSDWEDPA